jgi:CPA1 family monovalent cation:H+ antiporter
MMTWGGLRGGISIALALSLPSGTHRDAILMATYVVVLFSIVVQGLTLVRLLRHRSVSTGNDSEPGRK